MDGTRACTMSSTASTRAAKAWSRSSRREEDIPWEACEAPGITGDCEEGEFRTVRHYTESGSGRGIMANCHSFGGYERFVGRIEDALRYAAPVLITAQENRDKPETRPLRLHQPSAICDDLLNSTLH